MGARDGERRQVVGGVASDADREASALVLRSAVSSGAMDLSEMEQRLDLVYRSTSLAQLGAVTADLVAAPGGAPAARPPARVARSVGLRYHAGAYGLTNAFLVGTWGISGGGFFWPFFPAAGWGIGLGMHVLAVANGRDRPPAAARRTDDGHHASRHAERQRVAARPTAALAPPPPATPATRFVVVLFTDVVGSTGLTESLGDVGWVALRAEHRRLLRECFVRNGGREVSSQGDGFLARFDHPDRAVTCAIEIQRGLVAQREEGAFAPEVRIGVHCGEAVEEGLDLLGHVVNVAARVTAAAAPGEILVSEPVADHVDHDVHLEDRGIHTLRGVARPRHLLAVVW